MFQPTPAGSNGLLNADAGLGISRAPSAPGIQPVNSLQQGADLFSSHIGRSQSPAGSLTATPRPGLHHADPFLGQPLQPDANAPALGSAGMQTSSTWSSLDGIQRAFQGGSEIALQSVHQQQQGLPVNHPSLARSATYNLGTQHSLSGSLDESINRGSSVPPIGHQQLGLSTNSLHGLANQQRPPGLPTGLTLQQQQQLLQAQALQQQKHAGGYSLNGFNGGPPGNMQSLANLQAAAQAAQVAAAQRQQQLLRNQGYGMGQHSVGNLGNLGSGGLQNNQNNILLQQALLNQQLNQAALLNQAVANRAQQQQQQQAQQLQNQLLQGQLGNLAMHQGLGNMGSAGFRPGALNSISSGGAGLNPAVAAALLNGGLQGNNNMQAFTAQMQNMQNAQQLLSQAFRTNTLQTGLPQARPGQGQLQSEALIAMQRQQAMQTQGARGIQGPMGGMSNDAMAQLAQLGLLGKQAPAQGNLGITPQQQAALLNALQAGNQGKMNLPNVQHPQQPQQRGALPPGLANGASFLNGTAQVRPLGQPLGQSQVGNLQATNSILASSVAQQQQHGLVLSAPQTPRSIGSQQTILTASLQGGSQSDPIQTLQDIGRTLAQLNITVDAAVNAGLLGGLSASDVRIVGDAHGQEVEKLKLAAANPAASGAGTAPPSMAGTAPASPAGSVASAASAPLPAGRRLTEGSSLAGEEKAADESELLLDVEPEVPKAPVDEEALRKRVEAEAAARFDAGQYGFFAATPQPVEEEELLTELESGEQASDADATRSSATKTPEPLTQSAETKGEDFLAWNGTGNLLTEELGAKLMLGNAAPTVQVETGASSVPCTAPQVSPPPVDLASLWGTTSQGDRNDPFGSATWRSGWTLGTGF